MQARRPTYYMSSASAEILERHLPGYIAALLERADLRLTDSPAEDSTPSSGPTAQADQAATNSKEA